MTTRKGLNVLHEGPGRAQGQPDEAGPEGAGGSGGREPSEARRVAPRSEGRLCFLAGHHPPAAVHDYGPGAIPYGARMGRLLAAAQGRAAAFFGGHVHSLEHLALGTLDVFVSGSTAMGTFSGFKWRVPASARPLFATSDWGFAILEASGDRWRVRFQDFRGEPLHCCEAARGRPCAPVECR